MGVCRDKELGSRSRNDGLVNGRLGPETDCGSRRRNDGDRDLCDQQRDCAFFQKMQCIKACNEPRQGIKRRGTDETTSEEIRSLRRVGFAAMEALESGSIKERVSKRKDLEFYHREGCYVVDRNRHRSRD